MRDAVCRRVWKGITAEAVSYRGGYERWMREWLALL